MCVQCALITLVLVTHGRHHAAGHRHCDSSAAGAGGRGGVESIALRLRERDRDAGLGTRHGRAGDAGG